jgi:hypothetical protein
MDAALAATADATAAVQQLLTTLTPSSTLGPQHEERDRLQRILSHLYFVRTALLDPQSPLATLVRERTEEQEGVRHAT